MKASEVTHASIILSDVSRVYVIVTVRSRQIRLQNLGHGPTNFDIASAVADTCECMFEICSKRRRNHACTHP